MPDRDSAPLPPPSTDPLAGKLIEGRWRLVSKLGEGGMGAVYLAEQLSIRGRRVAVKLLRAELAQNAEFVRRFRGEAERAAAVSDPRIVTVLDFGQAEDGELFLVMEYVAGDTLTAVMRAGPLPLARAVALGAQLADALHRVHEAGVVHRDVKPDNVMVLHGSDDLKLMDFGIARDAGDLEKTQLTQTGVVVGTPAYMAPEQITGGAISRQTDVYAWGVVVYAMLAGRRPFTATSASAIQYMHVHEPPPPLREVRPDVPAALEREVMRALEKKPEGRQRTMAEAAAALRAVRLDEQAGAVSPSGPALAAGAPSVPATSGVSETSSSDAAAPAQARPREQMAGSADPTAVRPGVAAEPVHARSRRGLLVVAAVAVVVVAAGAGLFLTTGARWPWPPSVGEEPARLPPDASDPGDASRAVAPSVPAPDEVAPSAAEKEALALAQFFLDRGEYDSAIEELESAQRAAPDSAAIQRALEGVRKAKKAEQALLGAAD